MKIDFYILEEASQASALAFACQLVEDLHQNNQQIYIHAKSLQEAEQLDNLLWTFKAESFIPHNLYRHSDQSPPPVQIGFSEAPERHKNILVNVSQIAPSFYQQFAHLIEVVFADPAAQQAARERYKQYRSQGFEINTHKLKVLKT